jgi:hypothetical protein
MAKMRRYKLKYTGGFLDGVVLMFGMLSIVLIPMSLIYLINNIEIIELPNE